MNAFTYGNLSLGPVLREGWLKVGGSKFVYLMSFVLMILAGSLVNIAGLFTSAFLSGEQSGLALSVVSALFVILVAIAQIALQVVTGQGLILLAVRRALAMPISYKRILDPFRRFWALLFTILLTWLIIIAVVALFLPLYFLHSVTAMVIAAVIQTSLFVYFFVCLSGFASALAVIGGHTPTRAVRLAISGVTRNFPRVFALYLIGLVAGAIGALLLGVGLLWAIPFSFNITGIAYREIFGADVEHLRSLELWR